MTPEEIRAKLKAKFASESWVDSLSDIQAYAILQRINENDTKRAFLKKHAVSQWWANNVDTMTNMQVNALYGALKIPN